MQVVTQLEQHYLLPSTFLVSVQPACIQTVLGSCIAVCLYDDHLKTAGMNHFMLPIWNDGGLASAKYGNIAIPKLIDAMLATGSRKSNLVAKVFGGANQVMETNVYEIGKRNTDIAFELLDKHNIPIIKSDCGGSKGRKKSFYTELNTVHLKYL
ncbi:MAG: chemotaxis protein CheD [Cyclobacteriaceae bacterium]|jgi:chemotaxis protein CheD|nr:chemotaxis protein CheD [Cytophagales bacterium]MCZ8326774.1 chemotaxis protein CheD [Cyclobacteriaceae bacterium]